MRTVTSGAAVGGGGRRVRVARRRHLVSRLVCAAVPCERDTGGRACGTRGSLGSLGVPNGRSAAAVRGVTRGGGAGAQRSDARRRVRVAASAAPGRVRIRCVWLRVAACGGVCTWRAAQVRRMGGGARGRAALLQLGEQRRGGVARAPCPLRAPVPALPAAVRVRRVAPGVALFWVARPGHFPAPGRHVRVHNEGQRGLVCRVPRRDGSPARACRCTAKLSVGLVGRKRWFLSPGWAPEGAGARESTTVLAPGDVLLFYPQYVGDMHSRRWRIRMWNVVRRRRYWHETETLDAASVSYNMCVDSLMA